MKNMIRFAALFIFFVSAIVAQADDGIPANCEYSDGAYYRPELFLRYEYNAKRLLLLNWNDGNSEQILESDLEAPEFKLRAWSPDCRYFAATFASHHDTDLAIYDTVNNTKVAAMPDLYLYDVTWSPDSAALVVETRSGAFLWSLGGQILQLTDDFHCVGRSFAQIQWNYTRNQLITVEMDDSCRYADGPIRVYDLQNGTELFSIFGERFAVSPDQSRIMTYGQFMESVYVYNLDTQSEIRVDSGFDPGFLALSNDNRYLAIGRGMIRIWDLQNLQDAPTYNYTGPDSTIRRMRFINNETIETVDDYNNVQRWDLQTGTLIEGE